MSPDPHNLAERSLTSLAVGPGAGIQLSSTNKFHPNRIMWSGTHDGYGYDCIWYSDDGGATYNISESSLMQMVSHTQQPCRGLLLVLLVLLVLPVLLVLLQCWCRSSAGAGLLVL